MTISAKDRMLISTAKSLVKIEEIPGGKIGTVASALRTIEGDTFFGVCLHLVCGLGFCAEHTAIATAVTQKRNVQIDTIVAVNKKGILAPCGRCRELMNVLSDGSADTQVILSEDEKVPLSELLPRAWTPTRRSVDQPEA